MRFTVRLLTTIAALLIVSASAAAQARQGVMGELLKDVTDVETKVIGLAKAMPESAWAWRPSAGARTTSEVFLHIAADNYFLPAILGIAAPAETGITKEYKTAAAFEKKSMGRDAVMAELQKSFAFLKKSLTETPDAKLDAAVDMFGQKSTTRGVWITTTTHLHEHLGQLIAYARSNNIVPPWSK
jgi:DinB superfamily